MTEKVFDCVATAASGLEALVGKELRDLGIECQVENGRGSFQRNVGDHCNRQSLVTHS